MSIRVKEIGVVEITEIDLPGVPRVGDSFKLPDGTFVIAGNTYWENGQPPLVVFRRTEP